MTTPAVKASDPSSLQWWQKAIIYQIYPRSFQDSNGDGVGDLLGILSRLDYLAALGVGAVWLSPFYQSPQHDFGYDVANFCDVEPMFGTLQDFDRLVEALHARDIKVIIDLVPGHSSHLHPWFQKSVKREEPYTDYYVWHDGKLDTKGKRVPPNNWLSVFGGSAWTWSEERQQYYYRPFLKEQPKLNYANTRVKEEMQRVISFWLERGVDGLRVDAIAFLVEAKDKSLDEPINTESSCPPDQYEFLSHIYTESQPENSCLIKEWANLLNEYNKKEGVKKLLLLETYEGSEKRNEHRKSGGLPFNMDLIFILKDLEISGETVKNVVDLEYANLPEGAWPTFVLGNHDNHRVTSRHGHIYGDALNMLLLTLKGTPTTYYGEELGMEDIDVSFKDTQDPFGKSMGPDRYLTYSRDPERSPMQWDNSSHAGFTQAQKSWLPVHPQFATANVKFQSAAETSSLKLYKTLARLRRQPAFESGSLCYALVTPEIFSYIREDLPTQTRYLVVLNFGKISFKGNLGGDPVNAARGTVVAHTSYVASAFKTDRPCTLHEVSLHPGDGLVIKLET